MFILPHKQTDLNKFEKNYHVHRPRSTKSKVKIVMSINYNTFNYNEEVHANIAHSTLSIF